MLDTHEIPKTEWGVCPYVMIGGWAVPCYSLCVTAGLAVGLALVWAAKGKEKEGGKAMLPIVVAALIGGIVGAKLPYLAWNIRLYLHGVRDPEVLFSGRTILGGLIGGTLAVRWVKQRLGIAARHGDRLVPGIAAGLVLGRIGCFLRGCCYGTPTQLPWGVDFGDGLKRHPTELYEAVFCLGWLVYVWKKPKTETGFWFDRFMASYFAFRFFLEFIRVEPLLFAGVTKFQAICLPMAAWFAFKAYRNRSPWKNLQKTRARNLENT